MLTKFIQTFMSLKHSLINFLMEVDETLQLKECFLKVVVATKYEFVTATTGPFSMTR